MTAPSYGAPRPATHSSTTMDATIERPATGALSETLEALHPGAFAWSLACSGRDRGMAEEVLQTAYLKVLSGAARFDGRSEPKTFLYGVIRRTALEHRRRFVRERVRVVLGLPASNDRARTPSPEDTAVAGEASERLTAALARLSDRQREVLHLVFAADLTVDGAAEVMGVSVGAARKHYDRGKTRLRSLLTGKRGR